MSARRPCGRCDPVLVTVGDFPITANQLESAVASSPFATPFNAMDVDDQAAIRGNVLQRLVSSRLLYLEALRQGLDRGDGFRDEIEKFRLGLLYRAYMDRLRATIDIPEDVGAAIRQQTAGNSDARKAAEAAYRVDRFRAARTANLLELRSRYHVKIHESAIRPDAAPDTLLLDADGIRITLHDLLPAEGMEQGPLSSDWLRDRLVEHAEFLLVARAAEEQGVDLGDRLASFRFVKSVCRPFCWNAWSTLGSPMNRCCAIISPAIPNLGGWSIAGTSVNWSWPVVARQRRCGNVSCAVTACLNWQVGSALTPMGGRTKATWVGCRPGRACARSNRASSDWRTVRSAR
jgi:hypothetical protein